MSFTFDTTIPAAGNKPSVDQPKMKTNNASTNSIIAVDHYTFESLNAGKHKQVTFPASVVPGAFPLDPISSLYTAPPTVVSPPLAGASFSQLYYQNHQANYLVNCVRAFCNFVANNAGAISFLGNRYNISSITHPLSTTIVVTLTINAVNSENIVPIITRSSTTTTLPTIDFSAGVLTLTFTGTTAANLSGTYNIAILQA